MPWAEVKGSRVRIPFCRNPAVIYVSHTPLPLRRQELLSTAKLRWDGRALAGCPAAIEAMGWEPLTDRRKGPARYPLIAPALVYGSVEPFNSAGYQWCEAFKAGPRSLKVSLDLTASNYHWHHLARVVMYARRFKRGGTSPTRTPPPPRFFSTPQGQPFGVFAFQRCFRIIQMACTMPGT